MEGSALFTRGRGMSLFLKPGSLQQLLIDKARAQGPDAITKALEQAERTAVERETCDCGAAGCPRSAEQWWLAAAALQEIARAS